MKVLSENILLLTSLVGLCIVLPFAYLRDSSEDGRLKASIEDLSRRIRTAEKERLDTFAVVPKVPEEKGQSFAPAGTTDSELKGLCFFEPHEIGRFLMARIQGQEEQLPLFPPLELKCRLVAEGVELSWQENPKNEVLIRKLEANPLLTLGYKIYRWSTGASKKPEIIAVLPHNRTRYVDTGTGPVGNRFFYCVLSTLEGLVGKERTLIESERSKVESIDCPDRFTLRLLGGDEKKVKLEVSVEREGGTVAQIFTVAEGELIGGVREVRGWGKVDFTTGLRVEAIRKREEEREETMKHPVFNADGSRTLDSTSGEPLFREEKIVKKHKVVSIECVDPFGRKRILEEG